MSLKAEALALLGGTVAEAAKSLGVTYQAVAKWPDDLSLAIADRIVAHLVSTAASKGAIASAMSLRERCRSAEAERRALRAFQATTAPAAA